MNPHTRKLEGAARLSDQTLGNLNVGMENFGMRSITRDLSLESMRVICLGRRLNISCPVAEVRRVEMCNSCSLDAVQAHWLPCSKG